MKKPIFWALKFVLQSSYRVNIIFSTRKLGNFQGRVQRSFYKTADAGQGEIIETISLETWTKIEIGKFLVLQRFKRLKYILTGDCAQEIRIFLYICVDSSVKNIRSVENSRTS